MNGEYSNDHRPELMSVEKRLEKARYHLSGDEFEEAGIEFTQAAEHFEQTPENKSKIKEAYKQAALAYAFAGMDSVAQSRINEAKHYADDQDDLNNLWALHADIFKFNQRDR